MTYNIEELIRAIVREEIAKLGLTGTTRVEQQVVKSIVDKPVEQHVAKPVDTTIQPGDAQKAARDWFMRLDIQNRQKVISRLSGRPIHSLSTVELDEMKAWLGGAA